MGLMMGLRERRMNVQLDAEEGAFVAQAFRKMT
jgi:hypothetical protein